MRRTRREWLHEAGTLSSAAALGLPLACADGDAATATSPFIHGVASGDPHADSIVLWTRVTTDQSQVDVEWEIAVDESFVSIVGRGATRAEALRDHTVKVVVGSLAPATRYYYRFRALGHTSPVGRAKTTSHVATASVRLAVVSCASYAQGYFHAYRAIAERAELDAVVHLGDYLYEYGESEFGGVRSLDPTHETLTLADYRRRYAHYRSDPDLQAVHGAHAMIAVWDDHEIANEAWLGGALNHDEVDGQWSERRGNALQAYFEWMPVRDDPDYKVFRAFRFGDLVDLVMLDTRHWARSEHIRTQKDPDFESPDRTLLGEDQRAWLAEQLARSTGRWRFIGQQVLFAQLPQLFNADSWDGYPVARERFLDILEQHADKDCVVLTGDIHMSFANYVSRDPFAESFDAETGQGVLGIELVTPGVTSPGLTPEAGEVGRKSALELPHVGYAELSSRGYLCLDVDHERLVARWHYFDDVESARAAARIGGTVVVEHGQRRIVSQDG